MSPGKAPVRRCSGTTAPRRLRPGSASCCPICWGSERDYCQPHTELVREAKGIRVVRRFGPQQPTLPGLADAGSEATAAGRGRTRQKGVIG